MKLRHLIPSLLSLTSIGTIAVAEKCKNDSTSYCDDIFSSHLCGKGLKCEYNNACLAGDAGYDITHDCKPKEFCRKPDLLKCQIKDYKLYTCGKHLKCEYENKCLGKAAGYDIIHDCKPTNICRKPKNKKCKNKKSKEYICGDLKCEYKNKCLPKVAGYDIKHDCKPKNICRKPKNKKCKNIGSSYICGDLKCEYKNMCLAEAAGYDLTVDCEKVDTDEKSKDIGYIKKNEFKLKKTKSQPFSAKMVAFGPKSARSYSRCLSFEKDLNNAATIIVNDVIQRNSQYQNGYYDREFRPIELDSAPVFDTDSKTDSSSPDSSENGNDQESSYGTNNQIDGVDEADIVKATADIVFAGYGNKLVVFNVKTGEKMSETIMGLKSSSKNEISTVKVKGLLLHEDRLVVIITSSRNMGWGWHDWGRGYYGEKSSQKLISSYGTDTFVYLYDVSESELPNDGSEMKLLASHTIEGHDFNTARSIGNTTHLVTMSSVNINSFLENPLSRWRKRFSGFDADEYVRNATLYAKSTVIPTFVNQMLKEIDSKHNCSDIMKLSLFKSVDENTSDEKISVHKIGTLMQGLAQITTFNMDADYTPGTSENDEIIPLLNVSDTRVFLPQSYGTKVYASTNVLLIAAKGHKFWRSDSIWKDNTYIIGFSLNDDGSRVQGRGVGTVPGYLLNQWALDVWDDHIRVASTTEGKWGCSNEISDFGRFCTWTLLTDTDNQISVLKLPTDTEVLEGKTTMEMVGFLGGLGEVGERITSVRFMKLKAFLVTFRQTDPFYAIDMSNHSMPVEKSALKITGFSNYIHPYDKDGNILITVGQDATDDGRILGLQVSIFNATDLSNLSLLFRHSVENETNVGSFSNALFDHKAFRFLQESKKLIIPASIRSNEKGYDFDGFLILNVTVDTGISLDFKINQVEKPNNSYYCWYNGYLEGRSLVHNGILTTLKGHSILAHNLDTQDEVWRLNLDQNNTVCSGY